MGLSIVLESQNNFEVGSRRKIAPSLHSSRKNAEERFVYQCANAEDRDKEAQKLGTRHLIGSEHKEFFLNNLASPCEKSMPSKLIAFDIIDGGVVKRSSMYQGSSEIRRMLKLRGGEKNLEPYLDDGSFLSFELVNSTPWRTSNESVKFPQLKKEPLMPLNLQPKSTSVVQSLPKSNMEFLDLSFRDLPVDRSKISISYSDAAPAGSNSADSMLGICLQTEEINNILVKAAPDFLEEGKAKETKCRHQFLNSGVEANIYEKDTVCVLSKCFSEKVGISNSCYKEREILKSNYKTRFSPFKKMLDPVMKSKSLRNQSLMEPGTTSSTPDTVSLSRYKVFPRSLMNDFSKAAQKIDSDRASDQVIKTATSPVHLHAILKWEFSHGSSSYEFSVKDPEDVLSAKTWKTENAFNWVYTFHCCKMKSNSIIHGKKNRLLQPSHMIGQMQVSCYLCSEISEAGSLNNSAVTEFTLYDIAQARRSVAIEKSDCPSDSSQTSAFAVADSLVRGCSSEFNIDPSTSYPWASADLLPNLEIAAIVTQIPFTKKEALENMQARDNDNCGNQDLPSSHAADQTRVTIDGYSSPAYVKVVTPSGKHGLPDKEDIGPSSLLDRWRFGGGCDCGGWDMGCPIVVFDNANNDNVTSRAETQQPNILFVKGKKEKVPALTITETGKGQYAVDFHAQLSTLQAFSICIAILHSSEASSAIGQDNNKYKLYSNSLKLILEEEVRHIMEAVEEEEKRKEKRKVEQAPPFFFLDPPFSPMGRV
ncbi:hypothetical protein KFK09_001250 [Dendrobium nobile]|uniref:Uncharacterized protein n=1 Tax=Dendrobium nobile TaxID=94219 RepID=A0A8T3C6Y1_DENNO|nr:hypothetical protein KFK09_001250 [Dendrobium nobile]